MIPLVKGTPIKDTGERGREGETSGIKDTPDGPKCPFSSKEMTTSPIPLYCCTALPNGCHMHKHYSSNNYEGPFLKRGKKGLVL